MNEHDLALAPTTDAGPADQLDSAAAAYLTRFTGSSRHTSDDHGFALSDVVVLGRASRTSQGRIGMIPVYLAGRRPSRNCQSLAYRSKWAPVGGCSAT